VARLEPLDEQELDAWLRLMGTAGLGRRGIRRLLAALGSPVQVYAAGPQAWQGLVGAERSQALEASARPSPEASRRLDLTLAWLAGGPDRQMLTLGDAAYPAALLHSPDPPLLLYARGQIERLQRPAIAIVGTRHPSPSGREITRAWAQSLSAAGLCVVSGMALGIDAAAHDGALAAAETGSGSSSALSGGTVAVVGTGLDQVYPRSHKMLADRIAAQGLLLSEYPLGTPPLAAHFPQRNRLIAGLSQGTLVVEAALQSGSLITARLALEASREVWAVPGPIHAPQSRGCHALIKQGASLVDDVQDLLVDLGLAQANPPSAPRRPERSADSAASGSSVADLSPGPSGSPPAPEGGDDEADEDPVLAALGWSPATLDVLHLRTGLSTSELVVRLLELELESRVERLPGELFLRVQHG
jgi:DNA processing protein